MSSRGGLRRFGATPPQMGLWDLASDAAAVGDAVEAIRDQLHAEACRVLADPPFGAPFVARFEKLIDVFVTTLRDPDRDLFGAGWSAGLGSARWMRDHGVDPAMPSVPLDRVRAELFFDSMPRLVDSARRDELMARFGCFMVGYLRGVGTGEALEDYTYLGDVGRALTFADDPPEVYRIATEAAIVLCRADGASVALREDGVWRIAYQHGVSSELRGMEFPDDAIDGFTRLLRGESVSYDNLELEAGPTGRLVGRFGAHSVISGPLMIAGECAGALTVHRTAISPFGERVRAAMHVLALQTAANLREKRDAVKIRHSEARLRRLVEAGIVGVGTSTSDGRIVEANDALLDMLGYEHRDVADGQLRWDTLTAPQSLDITREMNERLRAHGIASPFEKEYIRKDGSLLSVMIGAAALPGSDGERIFYALDTTQRRRFENVTRALAAASGISSLDERRIVQEFADLASATIADWCGVFFVVDGSEIHPVAFGHRYAAQRATVERILRDRPLSENDPSAVAVRSGRPLVLTNMDDAAFVGMARDSEHLDLLRTLGPRSAMFLPLMVRGRAIGGLTLVSTDARGGFTDADLPLAELLATRLALAIENARQYERERRVASSFQHAALPAQLPKTDSFRFDAVYRPAEEAVQVGGDWYDAVALSEGRIIVSIGDVAGHGLGAAVTMGSVRQMVRGIAQVHENPCLILDAADRALRLHAPDAFVTAFVGIIDPAATTLTYASAGHPPPLLRAPDGTITSLECGGPPLGLRPGKTRRDPERHRVAAGVAVGSLHRRSDRVLAQFDRR